jgi:ornithine carbamoyltransferase
MKDLLRIADLSANDLAFLLDLAHAFEGRPLQSLELLAGETVMLYFDKPSTRTRISTETAVARLGGVPITVGPGELQLRRGETIADTARVVGSYTAAIVIRTFADDDVRAFAGAARVPVINALTDGHHPLQAVADLLTIRRRYGHLRGLKVAYVGAGTNVAHSLMEAAAIAGMDVAVATPPEYGPDPEVVSFTAEEAGRNGGMLTLTHDPAEAVKDADAVYTDVWLSMGDASDEQERRTRVLSPYQVDGRLLASAADDAIFMHCLPAHRGQEVTAEVIDGDRSAVFAQAADRLPAAQAVLHALVTGRLTGRDDR